MRDNRLPDFQGLRLQTAATGEWRANGGASRFFILFPIRAATDDRRHGGAHSRIGGIRSAGRMKKRMDEPASRPAIRFPSA